MQGSDSLDAYECGVYKTLPKRDIELDIIAGTSIGAVNAASDLERFWLTLAASATKLMKLHIGQRNSSQELDPVESRRLLYVRDAAMHIVVDI